MRQRVCLLAFILIILSGCAGPKYAKRRNFKRKHRGHGCGCSIQEWKQDNESTTLHMRV